MNYTFIFRQQVYFILSDLKFIGHGNPDNNLESLCITSYYCHFTDVLEGVDRMILYQAFLNTWGFILR
jgi:hypothetical protein